MASFEEVTTAVRNKVIEINGHLAKLSPEERYVVLGISELEAKNQIVLPSDTNLYLEMTEIAVERWTIKSFELNILRRVTNTTTDLRDLYIFMEPLEELLGVIIERSSKYLTSDSSANILRYWETLRERLNEAAYCHNLDDVTSPEDYGTIPDVKNTITLPVDDHFKIILEYHHGYRGLTFTSCKVDFHNFDTGLTRADGYLLAVEPMLKFIALVESNRDKESVEDSLPIEILYYYEKLLTELNHFAYGYNWDEVAESNTYTVDSFTKRAVNIGINSDFKIVLITNEPDSRGKPIASVQVKHRDEDCKRSLIEGYLEGIITMTCLVANVKSKLSSF